MEVFGLVTDALKYKRGDKSETGGSLAAIDMAWCVATNNIELEILTNNV